MSLPRRHASCSSSPWIVFLVATDPLHRHESPSLSWIVFFVEMDKIDPKIEVTTGDVEVQPDTRPNMIAHSPPTPILQLATHRRPRTNGPT